MISKGPKLNKEMAMKILRWKSTIYKIKIYKKSAKTSYPNISSPKSLFPFFLLWAKIEACYFFFFSFFFFEKVMLANLADHACHMLYIIDLKKCPYLTNLIRTLQQPL